MKRLFIILSASCAIACTKYKPDHDQVDCRQCVAIRQYWTDTLFTSQFQAPDTFSAMLCEQNLRDYQNMKDSNWTKYCDPETGITIGWTFYINQTK